MLTARSPNGRDRSVVRLMGEVAIAAEAKLARCASIERCITRTLLVPCSPSVSQALALLGRDVSDGQSLICHSLLTLKMRHMVRCSQR